MVGGALRGLRRWAAIVVLGGFAVACTGTVDWRQSAPPAAGAKGAIDACREKAAAAARREESRDLLAHGDITMNRGDALGRRMAEFAADRRRRQLLADCMKTQGAAPAK